MLRIMAGWNQCERCGHRWEGRLEKRPVQCPKCKSPYWYRKRVKEPQGIAEVLSRMKPVVELPDLQALTQADVDAMEPLCRACEGNLRLVQGKMVCVEAGCSMRGMEQ